MIWIEPTLTWSPTQAWDQERGRRLLLTECSAGPGESFNSKRTFHYMAMLVTEECCQSNKVSPYSHEDDYVGLVSVRRLPLSITWTDSEHFCARLMRFRARCWLWTTLNPAACRMRRLLGGEEGGLRVGERGVGGGLAHWRILLQFFNDSRSVVKRQTFSLITVDVAPSLMCYKLALSVLQ